MAKIFVSGGAGYLGSVLVPALLDVGHHVTVLDNFKFGQNSLAHVCHDPKLEIVRGDARDMIVVKPLLAGADVILPLAAVVGAPACDADQWGATSTNYLAIEKLCDASSKSQRIVIPITNSGYGIGEPGKECTEESPLRPISLYGRTKVQAEQAVMSRGNAVSLRLATVFGASPRMRVDLLLNEFVWKAVTERSIVLFQQHYMRNFIHVRDVARAFLHAINNFDSMRDQVFNVGDSQANMSKLQLCERIKSYIPDLHFMEAPVAEDVDQRNYLVKNSKIEATGWFPAHTVDDGIRELIKLYQCFRRFEFGNV
jgi:nucleoside-diphosphate-sugar epimerase